MKNKLSFIGLIILILLSACSGESTKDNPVEERVTPVEAGIVTKGDLTVNREITGRAMPSANRVVIPKVSGELVELYIEKGDTVEKGEVIGKVDQGNLNSTIRLQELAVQQAKKQLDNASVSRDMAEQNVENAEENVTRVQDSYEDMKELHESGAVSDQQLEEMENAKRQAEIALENAKNQLKQTRIGVDQARLQVEQAEIQLSQARDQLNNATITANASGEIVSVSYSIGDIVVNTQPFATIIALNPIKVNATVSAEELDLFEKDSEMDLLINPLDRTKIATISYVSSVADETGLYPIEASVENNDKEVKPGMMVTLQLPKTVVSNTLIVPTRAVIEEGGETYLYVIEEDKAVKRNITIVRTQSQFMAVEGDISENDQVVTKGQLTLSDGNKVSVMKEDDQS